MPRDACQRALGKGSEFGFSSGCPIISCARLTKYEVVRAENLSVRASADAVHRAGLEIHEDRAWDVASASGFVEVDVDTLELQIAVTLVGTSGINAVLITHNFPELAADLVAALATLDGNDLAHDGERADSTFDETQPYALSTYELSSICDSEFVPVEN
jgi:3-oxoacyl-(acyl-carrier-protein) synthase